MNDSQIQKLDNTLSSSWSPPAKENPWQWAEKNIELTSKMGCPIPGAYRTEVTPYVRDILEQFQNPKVRRIVLCFGAQLAKTQTELIALAYCIDQDPGPTMFVMPNQAMGRSISEKRIQSMVTENKTLKKHMLMDKNKFKIEDMEFDTMSLFIRWAGSPSAISSWPIKNLFRDEVDKWEKRTASEADPMSLSLERTKTFHNRKIVDSSTPTTEDGTIWRALNEGDFRRYFVPCPSCSEMFYIEFKQLKFDNTKSLQEIKKETYLECPHCEAHILERHKKSMLLKGEWRSTNSDTDDEIISYHLPELYSTFTKWGDLAVKFLKANQLAKKGLKDELQNFINSSLAEPWMDEEAENNEAKLRTLCDDRPAGLIPSSGVRYLTAGIDTQDDGFYFVINAWGADYECWKVRYGFVDSLKTLDEVIWKVQYKDLKGNHYSLSTFGTVFIDSQGHRTSEVYEFCKKGLGPIYPINGQKKLSAPWKMSKIDKYPGTDRPIHGGLQLIHIDTRYFKNMLNRKLQIAPTDPGAFHLHSDTIDDYFRQMTVEYKDSDGFWQCPNGKDNHYKTSAKLGFNQKSVQIL